MYIGHVPFTYNMSYAHRYAHIGHVLLELDMSIMCKGHVLCEWDMSYTCIGHVPMQVHIGHVLWEWDTSYMCPIHIGHVLHGRRNRSGRSGGRRTKVWASRSELASREATSMQTCEEPEYNIIHFHACMTEMV